jgi:MFS family permease
VLTIAWSLLWATVTVWWLYMPALLEQRGASDVQLGVLMGGMMFVGAGCGWLGGQLPGRVPIATVVAVCGGLLVAGIALTPASGALAVTAVVAALAGGLPDVIYAPLSTELQSNTSSEFRATTMSIAESGFSIQMLWLFPAAGILVDRAGWGPALALDAALLAVAVGLVLVAGRLPGRIAEPEPQAVAA